MLHIIGYIVIGFVCWIFIPILEILWLMVEFKKMERGRLWMIFFIYCIFGPFSLMLPPVGGSDD